MAKLKSLLRTGGVLRFAKWFATGSLRLCPGVLNCAYEHLGFRFADAFNRLFDRAELLRDFRWRCRFGERAFVLPVIARVPRSWNAARVWRWSGNRSIRGFYQWYLARHAPGIFFDVGANDGTHSYPFAAHGWHCVCFEPQLICCEYIQNACAANGFDNVIIVSRVVSDTDGAEVDFYTSASTWYSSFDREAVERFEPAQRVPLQTLTLDAHCERTGLRPSFLKIDVEGAELHVLRGGTRTIALARPDMLVEVSADHTLRRTVWNLLRSLGYRAHCLGGDFRQPLMEIATLEQFQRTGSGFNHDFVFLAQSGCASPATST